MKKNNWKSMVGCGVAAMTICMGAMTAMAAGTDTELMGTDGEKSKETYTGPTLSVNDLHITKNLKLAEGITVPKTTFTFEATSTTPDAPTATIDRVEYKADDNKGPVSKDGVYTLRKEGNITFGEFEHAGMYEYTVKETTTTFDLENGHMECSTATYKMRVYVENDKEAGLKVSEITVENEKGEKVNDIAFENIFTKNSSLTISKSTAGKHADRTKDFEFTLTFTKSGTADADATYTGVFVSKDTKEPIESKKAISVKAGANVEFKLHDNEEIVFDNLPAGTRYRVTETGTADYTPSAIVVENGKEPVKINDAKKGDSLSSAKEGETNLVGEGKNTVDFTNTYDDVPLTGLIINNLPFAILIGAAAALLALGTFARRFKAEK